MILNVVVVGLILLIAYLWTSQGLFSALMHFVCVVIAGAIAFAVWEPLTYGLLLGVHRGLAFTVGLMAPFLVSLALLRVATDKLIPANMTFDGATDFVGGLVFGGASAVLSVGLLVIAAGFMPLGSEFLGHRKVTADAAGNYVQVNNLWVPADELTARFYEFVSRGAFSPGDTALALRAPSVDRQASMVRATWDDRGLTVFKPEDFEIVSRYVIEGNVSDLTSDSFETTPEGAPRPQDVKRAGGEPYPAESALRGYVIRFEAGALEKGAGQVILGGGQARLVCRTEDGGEAFQPIAVVAQTGGEDLAAYRFRFDSPSAYIGSAGGASNPVMTLEFLTPADAEPLDLLIKNARAPLADAPAAAEWTLERRDEAVRTLELIGRSDEAPAGGVALPSAGGSGGPSGPIAGSDREAVSAAGLSVTNRVPGQTLSRQGSGGLRINDDNLITGGRHTFSYDDLGSGSRRVPRELRVEGFAPGPGLSLVQVDASVGQRLSVYGRALDAAERLLAPALVDANGQQYRAVGYVYDTGQELTIAYDPAQPIRSMEELPTLSRSRPNDELILLFRVQSGAQIRAFSLGGQRTLETFEPPVTIR